MLGNLLEAQLLGGFGLEEGLRRGREVRMLGSLLFEGDELMLSSYSRHHELEGGLTSRVARDIVSVGCWD